MQPKGVDVLHLLVNFTATPAMERLGIDLEKAMPSAAVAAEGLDNITNGPVWIVGGEAAIDMSEKRSQVRGRAEVVRRFATPQREAIVKD